METSLSFALIMCFMFIRASSNILMKRLSKSNNNYPVSENEYARNIDFDSRTKIETIVVNYTKSNDIPGASIAIAQDGKVTYANGFGWANLEKDEKTHYQNIFRVASVSKPITLVGILHLIENDKLELDELVFSQKLLGRILSPNITNTTGMMSKLSKVTVRHLLHHSGGFWWGLIQEHQHLSNTEYLNWALQEYGSEQLEPGTKYTYSNFGFFLLGRVIEAASGMLYEEYIKSSVLGPMGVRGAIIAGNTLADRAPDEVVYYSWDTLNIAPYIFNMKRKAASGGWALSTFELLRFMNALHSFLKPASTAAMIASNPVNNQTGLCWNVNDRRESNIEYWHGGDLPGTFAHTHHWASGGHVYVGHT